MRIHASSPMLLGAAALLAAGALALAGCSAQTTAPAPSATAAAQGGSPTDSGQARGGISGEVVQLGDAMFYLQGDGEQTTVGYDSSTTFTNAVRGTIKDVAVGSCIVAFGTAGAAGSSDAPTDSSTTAVSTVTVSTATDGTCTTGFPGVGSFGGGRGGRPTGVPTDGGRFSGGSLPSGVPTGFASGAPGGSFRGVGASGLVTAVDGDTITVQTTGQDGATASSTVTVDAATAFTVEQSAKSSALATGLCATVRGTADTSGGYAATSVALTPKGDNGCSSFTTRGGQGGGGQSGQTGTNG